MLANAQATRESRNPAGESHREPPVDPATPACYAESGCSAGIVKLVFCSDYRTSSWPPPLSKRPTRRAPSCRWRTLSYLTVDTKALVLGFALVAWVTIGLWLEVYEKLDAGHPGVILRDSARQCATAYSA